MDSIKRVGVVGSGTMGVGIAEVCGRAGCEVIVCDVSNAALNAGLTRLHTSLERAVRGGKLEDSVRDEALKRVRFSMVLNELGSCDLVIEAVSEQLLLKVEVMTELDLIVAPDAILASNTSSIPIANLAVATAHPGRLLGLHFFNPVPVLQLVEIVPSVLSEEVTVARAHEFVTTVLGKIAIRTADRAGFIVNALIVPYLLAAIRMFECGFATAADIDRGMELGCAQPMGPLRLSDFIGLDVVESIALSLYDEFAESYFAPPPLLRRMVTAGLLGKKSGRGFYDYETSK